VEICAIGSGIATALYVAFDLHPRVLIAVTIYNPGVLMETSVALIGVPIFHIAEENDPIGLGIKVAFTPLQKFPVCAIVTGVGELRVII
jgi:hypothetical protein